MAQQRMVGTVREFLDNRGFGFVSATNGESYFFLRSRIQRRPDGIRPIPQIGDKVTFLVAPINAVSSTGRKRCDEAIDVEVIQ